MIVEVQKEQATLICNQIALIVNELFQVNSIDSIYMNIELDKNNSLTIKLNCVYDYNDKIDHIKKYKEQLDLLKEKTNVSIIIQRKKSYYYTIVNLTTNGILISQELVNGHILLDKTGMITENQEYFKTKRGIKPCDGLPLDTNPSIPAMVKKIKNPEH